jgi:hypothetical protein
MVPSKESTKGRYSALAIMYASSSPILPVLSYDYGGSELDVLEP